MQPVPLSLALSLSVPHFLSHSLSKQYNLSTIFKLP